MNNKNFPSSLLSRATALLACCLLVLSGCTITNGERSGKVTQKVIDRQGNAIVGFKTEKIKPWQLIPEQFDFNKVTHKLVHVNVTSEIRGSLLRRVPTVPVKDVKVAIKDSIDASGLFRKTEYQSEADFDLEVVVLPSKIVKEGASEYFWSPARWKLRDSRTGELVFSEQIVKWHQISVDDVPDDVKRNTQLLEGAVKKNIKEGLEQLATVKY